MATEIQIQSEIIKYLKTVPGIVFWRNNVGGRGKTRYGEPGAPDIFIVYPKLSNHGKKFGALLGIEVKSEKGKLSESQQTWLGKYTYFGVRYQIAHSIEDVKILLREVEKQ